MCFSTAHGGGWFSPHPDPDVFVDLLHGLLGHARESEILDHLGACPAYESFLQACVADRARLRALYGALRRSGAEQSADLLLRVLTDELGPDGEKVQAMLGRPAPK
jgi:hypothetical protein